VHAFTPPFAWYETPQDVRYSEERPLCPACGEAISGRIWLPPYRVILKHARRVGDFVAGTGGVDLLVSQRFRDVYEEEAMTGIERFIPIEVVQNPPRKSAAPPHPPLFEIGTAKKERRPIVSVPIPILYGVYFKHTMTRTIKEEMGIEWMTQPQPDYCRTCGPGGGGNGGCFLSYERVVVDTDSWTGEDFFIAVNFPGTILLSDRAREFIERNDFTNCQVVPCEQASFAFF